MMDWNRIEPWDYIVVSVAAEYHKKYSMVELDDIKQSLYKWFLEHPNKLNEWEAIGHKDAKNLIYRSLRNEALDYCQKWKARVGGYEVSDLFYYEADVVEAMLPGILRGELTVLPVLNLGKTGKPPAPSEGGNLMAMMVEINSAYSKLSIEDRTILFYKYAESLDFGAIAAEMKLSSEDAARMRHNRAIRKLIVRMGGFRPWLDKDTSEKVSEEPDKIVNSDDYSEEYSGRSNDKEDTE
jgi:DNA-directed RNA polymerase specialized sigma24 family protein